jgi:glycosyltransferase involved in cell wall biosynthesis
MTRKILMIAFHYPPYSGSSGIHRTVSFSRYLPEYGWQPIVLTAKPTAYPRVSDNGLHDIHEPVLVKQAFALDAARHLSIAGLHFRWMALPDRWVTWWLGAVPTGLGLVRKHRPDVIWSTHPIATAHLIGLSLHCMTGIPWIADFRDPMVDTDPLTGVDYPLDPAIRRTNRRIEHSTVKRIRYGVFTTPSTLQIYAARYPEILASRWAVIENGYDERDFEAIQRRVTASVLSNSDPVVLVHSGALLPPARDPDLFFAALAELRRAGKISSSNVKIILRGSGREDFYRRVIHERGIDDIVLIEKAVPHRDALLEMTSADGLLIFQAANCNMQVPAKLYEYLRAKRPIFAMTHPSGDTAKVLKRAGIDRTVPLESKQLIMDGFVRFLEQIRLGSAQIPSDDHIRCHSRKSRTEELAKLLDAMVDRSVSIRNSISL